LAALRRRQDDRGAAFALAWTGWTGGYGSESGGGGSCKVAARFSCPAR
jgi:hypothetical protein